MSMINRMVLTGLVMMVVGAVAVPAWAAKVYLKNGRTMPATSIEWREGGQEYVIISGDTTIPIPRAQVDRVVVDKPADFDRAATMVKSRLFGQAIPILEGIVKKYRMLNWDGEAAKLLAQAYLETNDAKKAIGAMDVVFATGGGQVPPDLQMMYWNALLAGGAEEKLRKALDLAIGTGGPDLVSAAYVMRGNLFLKLGEEDDALSDFLKVTTLFQNVNTQQPEALFRAAELMDKARDPRGAELRKKLIQDYPGNPFAVKASAMPNLSGSLVNPAAVPARRQ